MDLDFTQTSSHDEAYDPDIAHKCFQSLGTAQDMAQGGTFFDEGQRSDRMYYLVEGSVGLIRSKKTLDIIKAGEVFGEMAVISEQPRSAAAVARSDCKALSMDTRQFQQALQATPEFALMLMNIMNNRLRLTVALMNQTASLPSAGDRDELRVFDKKMMEDLVAAFKTRPPQSFPAGRTIMKEGDPGVSMYIVLKGKVSVTIKGVVVERVGPGGTFGEMALVDQTGRAASAIAGTDCQLLLISRADFLDLVKSKPGFAISLLKTIAERLRSMTAQKK
jgi:CRP/FNR family cyclic AMP-dependent transcriptional regulator